MKTASNQLSITPNAIQYYIGIDPDVKKNGFSVWDSMSQKLVENETLAFYDCIVHANMYRKENTIVRISAGWLNQATFFHDKKIWAQMPQRMKLQPKHVQEKYINNIKAKISVDVGRNHCVGQLLHEVYERRGYTVVLVPPDKKGKWTPDYFTMLTKIRTKDQEKIDSASIIIGL